MKFRKSCGNCTLVEMYEAEEEGKTCIHCGYHYLMASHDFEDDWAAHQKNLTRLKVARDLVAQLEYAVEEFEKGWESTWNTNSGQIDFQTPDDFPQLDHIIENF